MGSRTFVATPIAVSVSLWRHQTWAISQHQEGVCLRHPAAPVKTLSSLLPAWDQLTQFSHTRYSLTATHTHRSCHGTATPSHFCWQSSCSHLIGCGISTVREDGGISGKSCTQRNVVVHERLPSPRIWRCSSLCPFICPSFSHLHSHVLLFRPGMWLQLFSTTALHNLSDLGNSAGFSANVYLQLL